MKHDMSSLSCGPADGLGISPPLVADDDPENDRARSKHAPLGAWRVCPLLRGIDLDLVLEARNGSVRVDHDGRRDEGSAIDHSLCAENDGDTRSGSCVRHGRPAPLQEGCIRRRHGPAGASIAGDEALGETYDPGPGVRGLLHRLPGELHGLFWCGRESEVRERDTRAGGH